MSDPKHVGRVIGEYLAESERHNAATVIQVMERAFDLYADFLTRNGVAEAFASAASRVAALAPEQTTRCVVVGTAVTAAIRWCAPLDKVLLESVLATVVAAVRGQSADDAMFQRVIATVQREFERACAERERTH